MHYERHCNYSYTVSNKSVIRAASTSSFVALLFCYFGYFDIFQYFVLLSCALGTTFYFKEVSVIALTFWMINLIIYYSNLLVHWIWNDRNFWFAWCTRYAKYNIFSQAIYFTSNIGVFTFILCHYTHDYA